jgi:hypothetical protein
VNNNYGKRRWGGRTTQSIIRGSMAALAALAVSSIASAQAKAQDKKDEITSPTTPAAITPPAGNSAFLVGHAVVRKAMFVCPQTQVLPGPSTLLAPKPPFLRISSEKPSRSSLTS